MCCFWCLYCAIFSALSYTYCSVICILYHHIRLLVKVVKAIWSHYCRCVETVHLLILCFKVDMSTQLSLLKCIFTFYLRKVESNSRFWSVIDHCWMFCWLPGTWHMVYSFMLGLLSFTNRVPVLYNILKASKGLCVLAYYTLQLTRPPLHTNITTHHHHWTKHLVAHLASHQTRHLLELNIIWWTTDSDLT